MNNNKNQNSEMQFSLSFHQERIFFIDEFETNNVYEDHPVYHNLPWIVRLSGEVDGGVLQQALDTLVARHEILRTGMVRADGEGVNAVVQQIYEQRPVALERLMLESHDEQAAMQQCIALADRPFDLFDDTLIRATLLQQGQGTAYLVLVLHHIIADRHTLKIVHRELWQIYGSLASGQAAALPEPKLQYVDFSEWQRQLPKEQLNALFVEWQYALRNKPSALELPLDHPRPGMHVYRRGLATHVLSQPLVARAEALCRQYGLPLKGLFSTAFATLLKRYSEQDGIYFGTSFDLRDADNKYTLTGPVDNLVVLSDQLVRQPVNDVLASQQALWQQAEQLQAMPFDELVRRLKPNKDMSRTALFDVMLSIDEQGCEPIDCGGVKVEALETNLGYGKYDFHLLLQKRPQSGEYEALLVYNQTLYDAYFAEQMNAHFVRLLEAIIDNPERAIDEMPLVDAEAMLALGESRLDVGFSRDGDVVGRFEQMVERFGGRVAVGDDTQQLSYRQLDEVANRLARHILTLDNASASLVGICIEPSADAVVAMMAVLKAGLGYLPLDPTIPKERIAYILDDAGCRLVVTDALGRSVCADSEAEIVDFADSVWRAGAAERPAVQADPQSVAYCIYTSGSTGLPKGVLVTRQNLLRLLVNDSPDFEFTSDDVWTVFHNLNFDFSVWEIYGALLFGGRTVVINKATKQDPARYLEVLVREKVTIVNQTPSAFYNLSRAYMARETKDLAVRHVIFGGEALTPLKLQPWAERHPQTRFVNMYGITETTVHVSYKALNDEDMTRASSVIGRPIATTSWYILDQHRQPVPKGVAGELYVGGAGVAKGYLNRPELDAQRFIYVTLGSGDSARTLRLYRTGDKAKLAENGEVIYLGRLDDQIQIRGFRVELGEIQSSLLKLQHIKDAVVIATDHYLGQMEIIAYLVAHSSVDDMLLRAELVKTLPEYMIPAVFVTLDELPLTVNSKLDSAQLPDPAPWRQSASEYVAPTTELEAEIAETWQQQMQLERVGIKDNFFELGGHSLLATAITATLYERYRVEVPIRVFFENPTIAYLAHWISAQAPAHETLQMEKRPAGQAVPLSFSQQRMWFIDKLDGGSPQYNMPLPLRIKGPFDVRRFNQAANELLAHHDILRTVYPEKDGTVLQQIRPHQPFAVPVIDLSGRSEAEQSEAIAEHLREEFEHVFNLAEGQPIRFKLLKVGEAEHVLFFNIHHIACDGVTMKLLVEELTRRYHAEPVASPRYQFADFVHWQQRWLESDACRADLDYWKHQLAELPELHSLPLDKPRPNLQQTEGGLVRYELTRQLTGSVEATALKLGVTPNILCQSVFALLLSKWSYEKDIVFGIPVAGRFTEAMQDMIGYFSNTLVMRYRIDAAQTFGEFVEASKSLTLAAFEHQKLPFDSLVDEINPTRSLSYTPLYQIMFRYESAPKRDWQTQALHLSEIAFEDTLAKFDLALHTVEKADTGTVLHWVFADRLFEKDTIEKMNHGFVQLLLAVCQDSEAKLGELKLIGAQDSAALSVLKGQSKPLPYDNAVAWFERTAETFPDAVAVEFEGETLSYEELDVKSNRLARFLQTRGVGPDALVGLCVERNLEAMVGIMAVLKAGGAFVPMDPDHPAERLECMIEDAEPVLILSTSGLMEHLDLDEAPLLLDGCAAPGWAEGIDGSSLGMAEQLGGDNLAYVIYTSGSTGKPKGVLIKHRGLVNYMNYTREVGMGESVKGSVVNTSLGFDASITTLFAAMTCGGKVAMMPHQDKTQHAVSRLIEQGDEAYLFMLTPSHLDLMACHWPADFCCEVPHTLFVGGESFPPERAKMLRAAFPKAWIGNHYGPTETVVGCTMHALGDEAGQWAAGVPIGGPVFNCSVYVVNLFGELCPKGVPGQLYVGGEGVARGYLNQAELTAEKFVDGAFVGAAGERLYTTGDLVKVNGNDELEYVCRIDQQVKIRGFRIELGEIEQALLGQPDVKEAKVLVASKSKQLIGFLTSPGGEDPQALSDRLKSALKARLPDYMVPTHLVVMDALPVTTSGKLDSNKLQQLAAEVRVAKGQVPTSEVELKLAAIWQSVLRLEQIGLEDDFFELGGHSLLVVRMLNQIEQQFDVVVDVRSIFNMRKLGEQANLLQLHLNEQTPEGEDWELLEL